MKYIHLYRTGLIVIICTLNLQQAISQGCSDAGFCTIGSFKHSPVAQKNFKQRLSLQTPIGMGDENVAVFTPAIQYELEIKKLTLQGKITANYATGNLGNVFGAGDIFLTGSYLFSASKKWQWLGTGGLKLPLDPSNSSEGGYPLPLQYQSSLGTVDIIAGLTAVNRSWRLSFALQQPLTKANKNGFLQEYGNDDPEAARYPASNRLQRKGDLLLRMSKDFSTSGKWQFNAGLLNIWHLGKDRYSAIAPEQKVTAIEGSQGLTINITGSVFYKVSEKLRLGISGGTPVVAREVRPDGLTRSWVLSPEISWQF